MCQALKRLAGERRRFTGTISRHGVKLGWKGRKAATVLLTEIKDSNDKLVADHLWFNLTKEFENLVLTEGTRVGFDARVKPYYRGYQGHREDINKPVERDFRLANPTNIQVIPYSKEYEAEVRKWQQEEIEKIDME